MNVAHWVLPNMCNTLGSNPRTEKDRGRARAVASDRVNSLTLAFIFSTKVGCELFICISILAHLWKDPVVSI